MKKQKRKGVIDEVRAAINAYWLLFEALGGSSGPFLGFLAHYEV